MVAAKVSFRTENGLVENLKFSSGPANCSAVFLPCWCCHQQELPKQNHIVPYNQKCGHFTENKKIIGLF